MMCLQCGTRTPNPEGVCTDCMTAEMRKVNEPYPIGRLCLRLLFVGLPSMLFGMIAGRLTRS